MDDDRRPVSLAPPARAPVARVVLTRRPAAALAPPVRVVEVPTRRRAATAGGAVWVLSAEHAVEEIPPLE